MQLLILAAAIVVTGLNHAQAGECKIPPAAAQAPVAALPDSLPAFFEPEPPPSQGTPIIIHRPGPEPIMHFAGAAPATPNSAFKRIVITVNGEQHVMVLPANISAADEAKMRAKAKITYGPETNPVILALKAADAKALATLIARGVDVRTVRDRHDRPVAVIATVIEAWFERRRAPSPAERRAQAAAAVSAAVKALVLAGADVLDVGPGAKTPLALIALAPDEVSKSPEMVALAAFLLEHGASLAAQQDDRFIRHVARAGNVALLDVLLRLGKPTQADKDAALAMAVEGSKFPSALLAINAGAKCCDWTWVRALGAHRAPGRREFLKALIDRNVTSDFMLPGGVPLLLSVMHDHEIMEGILKLGASPNARGHDGTTPLHAAMEGPVSPAGRARSLALLLKYGAVPTLSRTPQLTPLMLSTNGDREAIALLLKAGDRIDTSGEEFQSLHRQPPAGPMYWAALKGNDALGVALAGTAAQGADDRGAIFYAASGGLPATLNALLDKSRRHIGVRDERGQTALIAAASAGHASTVAVLLDRGAADINEVSRLPWAAEPSILQTLMSGRAHDRRTALMEASLYHRAEVVALLMSRGADPGRKDSAGRRAADLATRFASDGEAAGIIALLECEKKPVRK
jgi:uncharacterized protein